MKKAKSTPIKILLGFVAIILAIAIVLLSLFLSALQAGHRTMESNFIAQEARLEYLKNEYYVDYTPCNEQALADFDIKKACWDGVKFNEVAFIGTHNSYQILPTKQNEALMKALDFVAFGAVETKTKFEMDSLTEQLELGIRNLELDIVVNESEDGTRFRVNHTPLLDNTSNAYDFEKALEEIKLWSDNNPEHMPITIIIEPKEDAIELAGFTDFTLDYGNKVDEAIRNTLGETLLTPADMLRRYESFKEMREADDWMTLNETRGKILILLHDCDFTDAYIAQDESIKTQAMFPMLRYDDRDLPYASFILNNDPENAVKENAELIDECKLVVRTRADDYPTFSDERYALADQCGSQIITTDFPHRAKESENHIYDFDGYMFKLLK